MATKLTLEQIAELANTSRSAVSRVVNHQNGVKPEVRERILQVITETGYQPNAAARSLASRHSNIIGLVIPRTVQSIFTDPYFPRLIQGIAQACNDKDYTVSLFILHTEDEEQKLYPRVVQRSLVDGVIITSSVINDPLITQLEKNKMPFVVIGRPDHAAQASYVDVDNVNGAITAVSHLYLLGRRRIATITGPLNTVAGIDRRQGYIDALNGRSHPVDPNLIVEGDFTESGGYAAMQRLLPHQPDAIFVASDVMAYGALRALREANLTVPGNVAVVGFDDLPTATTFDPPLTTVRQPIRRTGALAVETLIDLLETTITPPRRILLDTFLVVRGSCGGLSAE